MANIDLCLLKGQNIKRMRIIREGSGNQRGFWIIAFPLAVFLSFLFLSGYLIQRNIVHLINNLQDVASYLATQYLGRNVRINSLRFDLLRGEIILQRLEIEGAKPALLPLADLDKLSLKLDIPSIIRGKDIIQSIKKIDINTLKINLYLDEKGNANLPRPKPLKLLKRVFPSFPIQIKTFECKIQDNLLSKKRWITKGGGKIVLHRNGSIVFLTEGTINGAPFTVSGISEEGRRSIRVVVKALQFSLPYANGLITTNLILQSKKEKLFWEAQASLHNAAITHKKLPFKILNISFNLVGNQDVCWIKDIKASTDDGMYFKKGEAIFSLHEPHNVEANGVLEGNASSLRNIYNRIGKIRSIKYVGGYSPFYLEFKLFGKLKNPVVEVDVAVPKVFFRGLPITQTKVNFLYFNKNLELREGESHLLSGKVSYKGILNLKDSSYICYSEAENIDLTKLPTNIKSQLTESLEIREFPRGVIQKGALRAKAGKGETQHIEIEANISQLKYLKVLAKNLYTKVNYQDNIAYISPLYLNDEKGTLAFVGKIDLKDKKIYGDLEGMDIDIGKISQLFGIERTKGFAYLRGKVSGSLNKPEFEVGTEVFNCGDGDYDVDYIFCMVHGNGGNLWIPELSFTKGIGRGTITGEANLTDRSITFKGTLHDLPISQLLPHNADFVEAGIGEGEFQITGSIDSPILTFKGQACDLVIKDTYVKSVDLGLRWKENKGVIEEGRVVLEKGEVNFRGDFDKQGLKLGIEGKNFSFSQIPLLKKEGLDGFVDFKGVLEGPFFSPSCITEISGEAIFKGNRGKLKAKLFANRYYIECKDIDCTFKDGSLSAALSYSLKNGDIFGYLQGENLPVNIIEKFTKLHPGLEGLFAINITFGGNLENPKVKGIFSCNDLGNHYVRLSRLEGKYSLEDGVFRLEDVKGEKEDFTVDGKAEYNLSHKDYSFSFVVKKLPLSMLKSLIPQLQPEGKGNLEVRSKGNISNPLLYLQFDSQEAKFNDINIEDLKVFAEWGRENLILKEISLLKDGKEVKGEGNLPLAITGNFDKDKPLYFALQWEDQDISWLKKLLSPYIVDQVDGQLSGTLSMKGTFLEPELSGFVFFQGCDMKLKGFEDGLKNTNGKLVFHKNRATFENFTFHMGEGKGELKGNMYMGEGVIKLETVASLTNITLKERNFSGYGEKFQGILNGFVNITGNIKSPLLLGSLSLSNAKLDLSSFTTPKEGKKFSYKRLFNPAFLVTIALGNNCWFVSSGSRVLTEGRLSIIGSLITPRVSGHFSSRSGTVLISNHIFKLREGVADVVYTGNVLNLNVFARAETRLRDYKITAYISGPYENLQLRFTSSPPLPQSTILAMFVPEEFLGNPEQFLKGELASAFAAGLEAKILAPLEFALAEATGLEEISFEYGLEGYPILRLKQNILPKTYIVYSRWLTTPQERYTFTIERNIIGDVYLTFTTDEQKRKVWGIEGAIRF